MSTIAVLCVVALAAVVVVGIVGAFSAGKTSLDDVYARHRARQAVVGDVAPTDPWVTDARADAELGTALVPEPRSDSDLTARHAAWPERQAV